MVERSRLFLRLGLVAAIAASLGITTAFLFVTLTDLPQVDQLERYDPKGVTTLRDIRGNVIHEFYRERRISVPLEKIPIRVRKAFLAAEDWRFYEHFGIDLKGMFRAFVKNTIEQRYAEGASTITQQLSKVLFLSPEKTLARKLREALLAIQIERKYSKNEILGLYLNQIYFGAGCYGVEAASQTYFGKTVADLTVPEMALLAGLPKAPNIYSPFKSEEKARQRRDVVLKDMLDRGIATKEEWREAREAPLPVKPTDDSRIQSYFASYILGLLTEEMGEERIFRGKLDVQTTLDLDLQKTAEAAALLGVGDFAKRHKIPFEKPDRLPQVGILAVDSQNGEIRAMVGGRSFSESQFNRAIQASRQPGSSFKPMVYAAALERGYTQSSQMEDEPISFENSQSGTWEPKNYEEDYEGLIPLRVALEKSKNVVAVRLLQAIGVSALQQMVSKLGITSPIAPNLTSALGSSSMTLPELARAYATFANGGIRPEIKAIRSVRTESGTELWPPPLPSQPVLDPRTAYMITDMLTGVIQAGTGQLAKDLPCTVAGKTGTTDDSVDALFAGFSHDLVAVTWIGFDNRKTLGRGETGAVAALPMWKMFMAEACKQTIGEWFPPKGVILVDVDHSSGLLPGRYCTDVVSEAFLEGTAPSQICSEESLLQF